MMNLLGVKIDQIARNKVLSRIETTTKPLFVVTLNPEILLHAWRDSEYRKILNSANMRVVDGFGIVLMARLLYGVKLERFAGADLANEILKWAAKNKKRLFLLGGSKEVNEKAFQNIISNFPACADLRFAEGFGKARASAGRQFPIFERSEKTRFSRSEVLISNKFSINQFSKVRGLGGKFSDEEAIKEIKTFKPDILLVALGAPNQEIFIHKLKPISYQLKAITMGIGGTLDYWAYPWLRAPSIVRQIGFEWLWRLVLQPWRLRRIFNATIIFPFLALYEKLIQYFRRKS